MAEHLCMMAVTLPSIAFVSRGSPDRPSCATATYPAIADASSKCLERVRRSPRGNERIRRVAGLNGQVDRKPGGSRCVTATPALAVRVHAIIHESEAVRTLEEPWDATGAGTALQLTEPVGRQSIPTARRSSACILNTLLRTRGRAVYMLRIREEEHNCLAGAAL
ncbi:hypothetical protein C8Q78DRAFT_706527 [Trametes maxima]|nr:hypothetical protein C8Q78DRAFT_706527 [Trametes maxima]